ncbi:MAG: hypothetical protein ABNH02_08410 [Pseudomonadales bacterium]|jgi:hypothetical protein
MTIYLIIFFAVCLVLGGIAMVKPSKREQQLSRLRQVALSKRWQVSMEKDSRTNEFVTVYRYQDNNKRTFKIWRWRHRYRDDFLHVPEAVGDYIKKALYEDERFMELATYERGIVLKWREFGSDEDVRNLLDDLLTCLNASINANNRKNEG